jgi:hypothetical protein
LIFLQYPYPKEYRGSQAHILNRLVHFGFSNTPEEGLLKVAIVALATLVLSACASYAPQRYAAVPDNIPVLRSIGLGNIKVESFVMSAAFAATCRGGITIDPPINMTFQGYLQAALADELKIAGLYNEISPRIVLSGNLEKLEFSSTKNLTKGEWNIGLQISSSNGRSTYASERYEFESGFGGTTACRRSAEAFLPAVQSLISKLVRSREFRALIET